MGEILKPKLHPFSLKNVLMSDECECGCYKCHAHVILFFVFVFFDVKFDLLKEQDFGGFVIVIFVLLLFTKFPWFHLGIIKDWSVLDV